MQFSCLNIVLGDLLSKLIQLVMLLLKILSFSDHICTRLAVERRAGFHAAWAKKLKICRLPTLTFVHFFTISRESQNKAAYQKKWGSPTIRESKLRAKLSQQLPALYFFGKFSQRARSLHDVRDVAT